MARFLQIAMGSASELEYQLLLAHDLHYLSDVEFKQLDSSAVEIKRMLSSLMRTLRVDMLRAES